MNRDIDDQNKGAQIQSHEDEVEGHALNRVLQRVEEADEETTADGPATIEE